MSHLATYTKRNNDHDMIWYNYSTAAVNAIFFFLPVQNDENQYIVVKARTVARK